MEDPGENIRQILKQVLDKDHVNRLGSNRHRIESISNLFQHGTEILGSTTGWNFYLTVHEHVMSALKQHFI